MGMRESPRLAVVILSAALMGCSGAKKKPVLPVVPLPRAAGTSIPPVVRMPPAPRRLPVPMAAPEPEPPPPAPQLGVKLAPSLERQFRADLDRLMASAHSAVASSGGQTLNAAQRKTMERIRSFLEQASAARDKDPATALQLAKRADLLGQDLLKSLPRK